MTELPDLAARYTALTAIDRTLLVEAGAGSGKTSVMAGRVTVLFANGIEPKHIAAVTLTEFAASELRLRIERFATTLSNGQVPQDLVLAFPKGLSVEQQSNVERACKVLDQLTCTTIHGFAQALIKPYPAEANIDPGADIVDPTEADLAFEERYDAWLRKGLSVEDNDGIVAELVLGDEAGGLRLIDEVAQFLRRNRDAGPVGSVWSRDLVTKFTAAAQQFGKDLAGFDFCEEKTATTCKEFLNLMKALGGPDLEQEKPSNRALVNALNFTRHESCFTQNGARRALNTATKWQDAAASVGRSKADGRRAYDGLKVRYENCHDALEVMLAAVAGELLARLAISMEGLIKDWRDYKRDAALLDFDDLLYTARDLLAGNDEVRRALSKRYRHVLIDEFQDTDPLQIEILWLICGEHSGKFDCSPLERVLRPGALFLVGDPKQAIYRFRGADVNAYIGARTAIGEGSLLQITANFRSVEPILAFANRRFEKVLSKGAGQPGFSELSSIHEPSKGSSPVSALDVSVVGDKPNAAAVRDAEASSVADLCSRLVGNIKVRDQATNDLRHCRYGDIALLAPVGTDLWRFEEALEDCGIPVSTQAGKGFFRRQEVQDLIALVRAIADSRDTLALGALLRGPLVGLTEAELLDVANGLPTNPEAPNRLPMLGLWTNPAIIPHDTARAVIAALQSLSRRTRTTTPYILLADAIAALHVRPQLRQRFRGGAERAVANVDLFLEMSRAYDVRGFRAFARDMRSNWEDAVRQIEGRPDAEQESVSLITVHASKGLEWPIVIPINMTGAPSSESALMQDRRTNSFSIPILGTEPSGHAAVKSWNEEELARERVRLWYVAVTRARDLLVLPRHSAQLPNGCWSRIVDLGLGDLECIDPTKLGAGVLFKEAFRENIQTREIFAGEATLLAKSRKSIAWHRPSRDELDAGLQIDSVPLFDSSEDEADAAEIPVTEIVGSSTRGTLLHKLMEEVLNFEVSDRAAELEVRAAELLAQLGIEPAINAKDGIAPTELAATVVRTLDLPEIRELRSRLRPELPIFGHLGSTDGETLVSGISDAVATSENGAIEVVVDWKSDVDAPPHKIESYAKQIGDYKKHTGAKRALLVMMTAGKVIEVR